MTTKAKEKSPRDRIAALQRQLGPEVTTAEELLEAQEHAAAGETLPPPRETKPANLETLPSLEETPPEPPNQEAETPAAFILHPLDIPLADPPVGSNDSLAHIDLRLDRRQSNALRRLYTGLDVAGDRLGNGRRVVNRGDAIRWLLEQLE